MRKSLSVLLIVCLLLCLVPAAARAEGTEIESVAITVTPPAAGTSITDAASAVSVSGAGVSLAYATWKDYTGYSTAEPSTLTFVEGNTYYAVIAINAGDGCSFKKGAEIPGLDVDACDYAFAGSCAVSGATLRSAHFRSTASPERLYVWVQATATAAPSTGLPATGVSDAYVDNTVDNSVSYVTGMVHITGSGGTQAGYDAGTTVYSNQAAVTYSTPKTAQVQGMIDAAETQVYTLANACKNNGSGGEFHMSTSESTGRVWDNRMYKTYTYNSSSSQWEYTTGSGDTEVYTGEIPSDASANTRIHVASGDYGKETYYRVEANGWVPGYTITVTDDGNGTASADLEASLAGETVTLTATPASGYAFKEWQVVSGGVTVTNDKFTVGSANVEVKAIFEKVKDVYIDNTVDNSVTYVTGVVIVTDAATGESSTQTVYDESAKVPYSTPKTAEVETMIAAAEAAARSYAEANGYTVTVDCVTVELAGETWDKRVYETVEDDDAVLIGDTSYLSGAYGAGSDYTRTHIASGEYGKTTCYRITLEARAEATPAPEYVLKSVAGLTADASHTWTQGSTTEAVITAKLDAEADDSFAHFTGVQIDGTTLVRDTDYTAREGSTIVTLKPATLQTLSVGAHTVTILFDNGKVETKLTVKAQPASATPRTGDESMPGLWSAVLLSAMALTAVVLCGRRRRPAGRHTK